MTKLNIISLLLVIVSSMSASATKCLKAQTFEDLKRDFPIIVLGKVKERIKSPKDENSFSLKVDVVKVVHGKFKDKTLKATEIHYGKGFWRTYEIGKEYTFLITPEGKKGAYEVTIPNDGCPDLPIASDAKSTSLNEAKAKEDFQAVLDGKLPINAVRDDSKPDLADGGTTFYKGEGYSLEIRKRLSKQDGKTGYMYGPKIVFQNNSASEMTDIRFYLKDDLDKKLSAM